VFVSVRSTAIGLAAGITLAAAAGIAFASIPDSSGVIHACWDNVSSPNKPLKLLNTSQKATCPSGWNPVSWNQTGPAGGFRGVQTVTDTVIFTNNGGNGRFTPTTDLCPSGTVAISGGAEATATRAGTLLPTAVALAGSTPHLDNNQVPVRWDFAFVDPTVQNGDVITVATYVECAH
jgi:hypothetical protein